MWIFIIITLFAFLMVTTIIGHFALQKAQQANGAPSFQPVAQPIHATTVAAAPTAKRTPSPRANKRKRTPTNSANAQPATQTPVAYATRVTPAAASASAPTDEPPPIEDSDIPMPDDTATGFQVLDDSFLDFSQPAYDDNMNHSSMDESSFNVSGSGNDENI